MFELHILFHLRHGTSHVVGDLLLVRRMDCGIDDERHTSKPVGVSIKLQP